MIGYYGDKELKTILQEFKKGNKNNHQGMKVYI